MKIFLITAGIIILLLVLFQIYTTMSIHKTETQAYKVIRVEKNFEIRYYPVAMMAMISSTSKSYRDLGSSGFGKLAKYIFGGNDEKKQIAMTSPVHMDINDTTSTMAFVLPSGYNQDNLPKPNDSSIAIRASEPEFVAVVKFGGFASTDRINKHIAFLQESLKEAGLSHHGNFRFLGYNPPYQLFGRRNEVIVALNENELNQAKN
jgi:SOUL heme-binding protein